MQNLKAKYCVRYRDKRYNASYALVFVCSRVRIIVVFNYVSTAAFRKTRQNKKHKNVHRYRRVSEAIKIHNRWCFKTIIS